MRLFLIILFLFLLNPAKADWEIRNAIYKVDQEVLNVRIDSASTSRKIGELKRHSLVQAVETSENWVQISHIGKKAFVYKRCLELSQPALIIRLNKNDVFNILFFLCVFTVIFFLPRWILFLGNYLDEQSIPMRDVKTINLNKLLSKVGYPKSTIYCRWLLGSISDKSISLWIYKISFILRVPIVFYFLGHFLINESLDYILDNPFFGVFVYGLCIESLLLLLLFIEGLKTTKWITFIRTPLLYFGSVFYLFSVILCSILIAFYSMIKMIVNHGPLFMINSIRVFIVFVGGILIAISQGGGDYWRGYNDGQNNG